MLELQVIEPAKTKWSSSLVFVPKEDGKVLFVVDYRTLNTVRLLEFYSITRSDEWSDVLGDKMIFSKMDANLAPWRSKWSREVRKMLYFVRHHGRLLIICKTLELKSAPGIFKPVMDTILSDVLSWVYSGNIVILLKSQKSHIKCGICFSAIFRCSLCFQSGKCKFISNFTNYLCFVTHA